MSAVSSKGLSALIVTLQPILGMLHTVRTRITNCSTQLKIEEKGGHRVNSVTSLLLNGLNSGHGVDSSGCLYDLTFLSE